MDTDADGAPGQAAPMEADGWVAGALKEGKEDKSEAGTAKSDGGAAKSAFAGLFGSVVGGVKKRKVKLTMKQKRRKLKGLARSISHSEVKGTKHVKANAGRARKTELKGLW
jgi:hypothetical protein